MRRPSGRAERRHHRNRMIEGTFRKLFWVETPEHASKMADNRKACSCWMCGNRRKHHGPPFQEVKAKMT